MEGSNSPYNDFFLSQLKAGSESAFEHIFKIDYQRIVGFCEQFIEDKDQSQNIAQEAFVKLWLNRSQLESVNGIHSFLYTAAKTDCLNYLKHQKVINRHRDLQLQAKEAELNREILESFDFNQLELMELEKLINQAIEELPEKCRLVFRLSRIEGKKKNEIANELEISVKSVEANITRALKTLKLKLSAYLPAILVHIILKGL